MDDKEYYSLMNRSNSALIIEQLQKKNSKNKTKFSEKPLEGTDFSSLEVRQGKADAEMLFEKNDRSGI